MNHQKKYCCYICGKETKDHKGEKENYGCSECELKYGEKLCFIICKIYGLNFERAWTKIHFY